MSADSERHEWQRHELEDRLELERLRLELEERKRERERLEEEHKREREEFQRCLDELRQHRDKRARRGMHGASSGNFIEDARDFAPSDPGSDDESDDEAEDADPPVSIDVTAYQSEIERIADSEVDIYGQRMPFKHILNVPLIDIARCIAEVSSVRSNVVLSAEQTNKTMTSVGIMKVGHVMKRPTVMFVMDLKRSVEALCANKVDLALQQFGIEVSGQLEQGFELL